MYKKNLAVVLIIVLTMTLLAGCSDTKKTAAPTAAPAAEKVTLTVAGSWTDCRALDEVAKAFTAEYPNVTIKYEYLQDYYASLEKRMSGDQPVDMFFTTNIQEGNALAPYALDLKSRADIDLSNAFDGLIENFTFREASGQNDKLYAIPLGAEMRGLFVNTTLLKSLNIAVPTNQKTLLEACETLKQNGYIPFHGNPGNFSQLLLYPWVCNLVANAENPKALHDQINAHEKGIAQMFKEPFAFLYRLVESGYYDYKTAQTDLHLFTETTDDDFSRDFLNVKKENDVYVKADDIGQVAFAPSSMSMLQTIQRVKEDYHSGIEYVFIPSPVGQDGGYVYLSPAHGIAVNKTTANVDWSAKFIDFLYQPKHNETFAKAFNCIPNTKEAFAYVKTLYDVPENRISQLGQVTFEFDFYNVIQKALTEISKGNNPKYMKDDGNGNLSLYPFEYYFAKLEESLEAQ